MFCSLTRLACVPFLCLAIAVMQSSSLRADQMAYPRSISVDIQPEPQEMSVLLPSPASMAPRESIRTVCSDRGFLFIDGTWIDQDDCSTWVDGILQLRSDEANKSTLAVRQSVFPLGLQSLFCCLPASGSPVREISLDEYQVDRMIHALAGGGVAIVQSDRSPWCIPISSGGYELLSAICHPPGPQRESLLNAAASHAPEQMSRELQTWLRSYEAPNELIRRASGVLSAMDTVEQVNAASVTAMQRFELWNYPMSVIGMITFVIAIGSLISVRPHDLVGDAVTAEDMSIHRFLWLIAAMSVIDLVWTLLAHQANQVAEVNPLGGALISDFAEVTAFKILATALAIGILYRLRNMLFARKACWWACLTLALLTARWVIVAGVTG